MNLLESAHSTIVLLMAILLAWMFALGLLFTCWLPMRHFCDSFLFSKSWKQVSGIISADLIRSGHRLFVAGLRTKIQFLYCAGEVHVVFY
jgi:hypothetical protein